MLLGQVIADLQDEAHVEDTLAELGDWVLMVSMRRAADVAGSRSARLPRPRSPVS